MVRIGTASVAFLALALATVSPAPAASWLEMNFYLSGPRYDAWLPPCEAPLALSIISSRFSEKEALYWASPLRIEGFGEVRELAYRPWGRDAIPRRFCAARPDLRRARDRGLLLDRRGYRLRGRGLGRGMVRGRLRPQPGLRPALPDGAAMRQASRLLFACLLLVLINAPAAAQRASGEPGRFDFYLLALSWSPTYCESAGARADPDQCRGGRPFAFVVHGLWPQYERGYPEFCTVPAPRVPEELLSSMLEVMPSRGLVIHQWRKHGTCSGLAPERYFEMVRDARARVVIPERFRRLDQHLMVSPAEVEDAFVAANPGLARDMIVVSCDQRNLREVRVCLAKDLAFRACGEIGRQNCRAPRLVMPPTRGG
jgi:ribonuclease T2